LGDQSRRVANAAETNPTRARFYPVVVRHRRAPTPNKKCYEKFLNGASAW
jgi:hypothetical protein